MGPKLIVGLGNPGQQYARNRHNIGFRLLDSLAERHRLVFARHQFRAQVAAGSICGVQVILAKPMTFMNRSGEAVGSLMRFYKLLPQDLLVIYDDLDLPPGRIRLRAQGGSGGHKGMISIIERIGTREFARLRIGIGRPSFGDAADYVLCDPTKDEEALLANALLRGVAAVEAWLREGTESAMNRFNADDTPGCNETGCEQCN